MVDGMNTYTLRPAHPASTVATVCGLTEDEVKTSIAAQTFIFVQEAQREGQDKFCESLLTLLDRCEEYGDIDNWSELFSYIGGEIVTVVKSAT